MNSTTSRVKPSRAPSISSACGRVRPLSAAAHIRNDLRNAIVSLVLRPGTAILEKDLARSYGVSRTPVREAIAALVEEDLVSVFPQAGTFVSPIPFHSLSEALVIRRSLEETSARLAAQRGTADAITAMASACVGARSEDIGGEDTFHAADEAFHAGIAEMAGISGLWRVVVQVKVQVDRYRRLTLPEAGRFTRILDEHEAILNAVAARDPDAAATAMGAHIGGLLADLRPVARANPDCFDMTALSQRAVDPSSIDERLS